jgi:hypothetical protein
LRCDKSGTAPTEIPFSLQFLPGDDRSRERWWSRVGPIKREDGTTLMKLLAAAALVAVMALPGLAQGATPTVEKGRAEKSAALHSGDVSARALLKETVKNAANETIGDVNDVLIGDDGKIAAVIVGVGGFLGMGEKDVALPYDQLVFAEGAGDDLVVTTSATKESLETAPEYVKQEDRP